MGRRKQAESTPTSPHNSDAKRSRIRTSPTATVPSVPSSAKVPLSAALPPSTVEHHSAAMPPSSVGHPLATDRSSVSFVSPVAVFSSGAVPPSTAMPLAASEHFVKLATTKPSIIDQKLLEDYVSPNIADSSIFGMIDDICINKHQLNSLINKNWLTSNIINCFMYLLEKKCLMRDGVIRDKFLNCVFGTYILTREMNTMYKFAKHFAGQNVERVFIPLFILNHYVLIMVNVKTKVYNILYIF